MKTAPRKLKGFFSITLVILIVIIGALLAGVTHYFFNTAMMTTEQYNSKRAFYLAEAAVERGIRNWSLNQIGYSGTPATAFGGGQITIEVYNTNFDNVTALNSNQKRIRGIATIDQATSTVDAIVEATQTNLLTNGDLNAPATCPVVSAPSTWSLPVVVNWAGPGYSCAGSGNSRALRVQLAGAAAGDLTTTTTQTINPAPTPAANTVFTLNYQYSITGGNGNCRVYMTLTDSALGTYSNFGNHNGATAFTAGSLAVTVPTAGTQITSIQVQLYINNSGQNRVLLLDDMSLTMAGGGGGSSGIVVRNWKEVLP